ncbi:MAG: D-alanyl-lipoteichoic acid biosynthesis protein DltD [Firmicutes bacterium]|nr:D-alanyl-lipoteichoic acid biosynthesis protein DltD [Bacillota bacterium]
MTRIKSFAAAALLFAVCIGGLHIAANRLPLKVDNGRFGTWFNTYKDLSYSAISENIDDRTVLVLGSSEFRHGRKTDYHPMNALSNDDYNLMTLGGPCNQILYHTIATGAFEDKLDSRKVILLVSPTWFRPKGVSSSSYGIRFSESEYIMFLKNSKVSEELREYVASRSSDLLKDNKKFSRKLSIINRALLSGKTISLPNTILYNVEEYLAFNRDRITAQFAIRAISGQSALPSRLFNAKEFAVQAETDSLKASSNPINISNHSWERKFSKIYDNEKNKHCNTISDKSKEFDDLEAFLKVCDDCNLEVKLIVLPVNGRWFDHIGADKTKRSAAISRMRDMAAEHGAEIADLSIHDYEPYITKDVTHPWHKGWVYIDEEIDKFCRR